MKKYLGSKIENIFTRGQRTSQDQVLKKIVSTTSYNYLMSNLNGGMVLPYNVWSISPPAMMVIINHILINNVKTIVEFGTGISTVFLNNLSIKNNLDLKIISVDHDQKWQQRIKEEYKVDGVKFIHAPLTSVMKYNNSEYHWYDVNQFKDLKKSEVDLIIIDGPIGSTSPYERAGAMEFFKSEKERPNFSCFLDDTDQGELKDVMRSYFPDAKFYSEFGMAGPLLYAVDPVIFMK